MNKNKYNNKNTKERNKYRVSLKFSENDRKHLRAVKILKQLGRKKSEFISICIDEYINNNDVTLKEIQDMIGQTNATRYKTNTIKSQENNNYLIDDINNNKEQENNKTSKAITKTKKTNNKNNDEKSIPIDIDEIPEIPTIDKVEEDKTSLSDKTSAKQEQKSKKDENKNLTKEEEEHLLEALKMFQ